MARICVPAAVRDVVVRRLRPIAVLVNGQNTGTPRPSIASARAPPPRQLRLRLRPGRLSRTLPVGSGVLPYQRSAWLCIPVVLPALECVTCACHRGMCTVLLFRQRVRAKTRCQLPCRHGSERARARLHFLYGRTQVRVFSRREHAARTLIRSTSVGARHLAEELTTY